MMSMTSWPGGLLGGIAVWRWLLGSESRVWTSYGRAYVSLVGGSAALDLSGRSIFILGFQIFPYIIHHYPPLIIRATFVCLQVDGSSPPHSSLISGQGLLTLFWPYLWTSSATGAG